MYTQSVCWWLLFARSRIWKASRRESPLISTAVVLIFLLNNFSPPPRTSSKNLEYFKLARIQKFVSDTIEYHQAARYSLQILIFVCIYLKIPYILVKAIIIEGNESWVKIPVSVKNNLSQCSYVSVAPSLLPPHCQYHTVAFELRKVTTGPITLPWRTPASSFFNYGNESSIQLCITRLISKECFLFCV